MTTTKRCWPLGNGEMRGGRHQPQWHAKYELSPKSLDQYLVSRPHCHSLQIHNCRASKGGELRASQWCGRAHERHLSGGSEEPCSQRNNLSAATLMCTDLSKLHARNVRNSTSRNTMAGITTLSLHKVGYIDTTSFMIDFFNMET